MGEVRYSGAVEDKAQVTPALFDAIAGEVIGDIEATEEGFGVVDDEEFPVITDIEVVEAEGVEPADFATGGAEVVPEGVGEVEGAEAIDEGSDTDAALGGLDEGGPDTLTGGRVGVDIGFEVDGGLGLMDGLFHCGEGVIAGLEPIPLEGLIG